MSSVWVETLVSVKLMNRSIKSCIRVNPATCSGSRDSQKAPIRSKVASRPKPSTTQILARLPPMT